MSFDIGMGRCIGLTERTVTVQLDSVLIRKWFPLEPWRKTGTSLLSFDRKICSAKRPPQLNEELYVSAGMLSRGTLGSLDLNGDGGTTQVDLGAVLNGLDPMPPPSPKAKTAVRRGDTKWR